MQLLTNLVLILLGCFIATTLSTVLGQTGDWGMLVSGIMVAFLEKVSKKIYTIKKILPMLRSTKKSYKIHTFITLLNNIKIGLLYGFFIEAFKLGS